MSSVLGARDLLTPPRDGEQVNQDEYLSDLSPRHKPWDVHRGEADEVQQAYAGGTDRHQRYALRVEQCSQVLEFARDPPKQVSQQKPTQSSRQKYTLKNAWFCQVRHCPVCQWRRSLMWQAKVYRALPALLRDFPAIRSLFMTLTIRNTCPVGELRATLNRMAKAWKRLVELRQWPARG